MSRLLLCLPMLLFWLPSPAWAELSASVDRASINANESLQLRITSDDPDLLDQLPLEKLEALFSIANRGTSQQVQIINGRVSRQATLVLTLFPNQSGRLVIPALDAGGEATNPITVEVGKGSSGKPGEDEFAKLELTAGAENVLAQQQLIVTLRLSLRGDRFTGGNLDNLQIPGAQVVNLGEQRSNSILNNHTWQVIQRRYAVFPQQSGELHVGPVNFSGILVDAGNSFFPVGRNYRIRSNSLSLSVQPPAYNDAHWLPAANLLAESSLSADQVAQGQAITRSITMRTRDQLGELVPELPLPKIDGVQSYLDGVTRNNQPHQNGVDGTITIKQVFIPRWSGNFTIPEQHVTWFNTHEGRRETLRIPEAVFNATASVAGGNPPAASPALPDGFAGGGEVAPTAHDWPAYTLAALLLASLLGNLLLWWRGGSPRAEITQPEATDDESLLFARLSGGRFPQVRDWLVACNHWLAMLGAGRVHSAQGLCQLVRNHSKEDTVRLQIALEDWFYRGGEKPAELAELLSVIRAAYGYPRNQGVYNSRLGNP